VNIKVFDVQHRRLIHMIGQLESAMCEGRARDHVNSLLTDLVEYAEVQLATEEMVLQAHSFPWRDTHAVEHSAFRAGLDRLRLPAKEGEPGIGIEALDFLQGWMRRHILGSDKAYSSHLNERGVF
jgi:hemerythrin